MMLLFLTISLCAALKLSDPASLRDVTEENMSLQAWCASTGCVMPFTPKSCQSWCDWNVDKQADAEARGAFGSKQWGDKKQVLATEYWVKLAAVDKDKVAECKAGKISEYNFNAFGAADSGTAVNVPIFPGGDQDKKYAQTYLACGVCYKLTSRSAEVAAESTSNSPPLATTFYMKFFHTATADKSVQLKLYTDKACSTLKWDPLLPALTAAQKVTAERTSSGALITGKGKDAPIDCLGIAAASVTIEAGYGGGSHNRKGLKVSMGVQFSGTAFTGVLQPEKCPSR